MFNHARLGRAEKTLRFPRTPVLTFSKAAASRTGPVTLPALRARLPLRYVSVESFRTNS